ncbi:MAG: isoleucine--tRNA ligase, partial [Candidatus Binatia bacterium]
RHPWIDRDSPVICGDHVTLEAGTGCVHTAPGHGHDDYVVGLRYGLEVYAPVDAAGRFTASVQGFAGRKVLEVDQDVAALLDSVGALLRSERISHSYPHCWRCKKPVIFRATDQWFISMDTGGVRSRALQELNEVTWVPSWGKERIEGMIANRPDWCLSRQRAWGVPMIALRCEGCDEVCCGAELTRHVADIVEEEGSDAWFTKELSELVPAGFRCSSCGGERFERETDVLDVWFDSGVSYAAVVEQDCGADVVADLYLEGSDQHRGWFHSSLLVSVMTRDRAPYRTVLTHGFVLDGDGRKMSKTVGNVMVPQKVIEQYGADILRLWVASEDYREDLRLSAEILKQLGESYRRVRNTARNLLGNLWDFDLKIHGMDYGDLYQLDRWILGRLYDFVRRCRRAYEAYEFHLVVHALNNFCSVDLSSQYFDIIKDRLYCSDKESKARRAGQTAMYHILEALTLTIAPVLSFTAEEIWQALPNRQDRSESVFLADFPVPPERWKDEELFSRWESVWRARSIVTAALERQRQRGDIGHSLDARVLLRASGEDLANLESLGEDDLAAVFIVSQLRLEAGEGEIEADAHAAAGLKCARCWNYRESVGTVNEHPDICDRCSQVVAGF